MKNERIIIWFSNGQAFTNTDEFPGWIRTFEHRPYIPGVQSAEINIEGTLPYELGCFMMEVFSKDPTEGNIIMITSLGTFCAQVVSVNSRESNDSIDYRIRSWGEPLKYKPSAVILSTAFKLNY